MSELAYHGPQISVCVLENSRAAQILQFFSGEGGGGV